MLVITKLLIAYKWQLVAIEVPYDGPQYDYLFAMRDNLKKAVVGIIFTEETAPPEFNLKDSLVAAWLTIPQNLTALADNALDPLGLNIGNVDDINAAANEQSVDMNTYKAMQKSFDGKVGAFAYLLFILLYAPCVAATAAIYRETNLQWAVFVVFWTTIIAYISATVFYQVSTFAMHPGYSMAWISGLLLVFISILFALWWIGKYQSKTVSAAY
jgi:ferrous iron transport protein B